MGYGGGGGGGGSGGSGGSGGGGGYTTVGGGSAFGGSDEFELPSYNQAPAGSIRFNTDSKKLEVYILGPVDDGVTPNGIWMEIDSWSPELQTGGTRGIIFNSTGGIIVYVNIDTTGNAISFGTGSAISQHSSCASRVRALRTVGYSPATAPIATNVIEFVTIASTGDAQDFGDSTVARRYATSVSDSTRGLTAGGNTPNPNTNLIDYVTIASTGNAITFGDLFDGRVLAGGAQSSTRGIFAGGESPGQTNGIEYVTISTQGTGSDFGDLTLARYGAQGSSNSVRGIFASGYYYTPSTVYSDIIEYITLTSLGDSIDFGNLTVARSTGGSAASPTRMIFCGGLGPAADTIDYVQIMSTGDAIDFGDLTANTGTSDGATSNGHGGL